MACSFEYVKDIRTCVVHKDCKHSCDLEYGAYGIIYCTTHKNCKFICESSRCTNSEPKHKRTCEQCGMTYCPHSSIFHYEVCTKQPHENALYPVDKSKGATVTVPVGYDTKTRVFHCETCGETSNIEVPNTGKWFYITCHTCNTMFTSRI